MIIQGFFSNSMIFPCMELFLWFSKFSMISRACGNPDVYNSSPSSPMRRRFEVNGPHFCFFCWFDIHIQLKPKKSTTICLPTVSFNCCCKYILKERNYSVDRMGCFFFQCIQQSGKVFFTSPWKHLLLCPKAASRWDALFDLILYVPVNNFSVMAWQVFMAWTSTKQESMCLVQGHKAVKLVRFQPPSSWSGDKHSTTELLRSSQWDT